MEIKTPAPKPLARRKSIVINAKIGRVITRPYMPASEARIRRLVDRVLNLPEDEIGRLLENLLHDFSHRHRYFRETLDRNFNLVAGFVSDHDLLSQERRRLIGAYFTAEYSVEAAALFNPSIVRVPIIDGDPAGSSRFVISFRATGEGHVSSIEFRSGYIDSNNDMFFDPLSDYVEAPTIVPNPSYNRDHFRLKLRESGAPSTLASELLDDVPETFSLNELLERIVELQSNSQFLPQDKTDIAERATRLAQSNYEIVFRKDHPISERVIFPVSESERQGIEDARFVRFVDEDDTVTYYATYTAYDGEAILPQLIETKDFLSFRIITLTGPQALGKGMALFPRKLNGRYAMLSRQDGENNAIMFSDSIHLWQEAEIFQEPEFPYEFVQIGNGGSPIETAEGWLLITHGVGPMRVYKLGIELLDLHDPSQVIGRIEEPILAPNADEREGYVPNVVYSCGAMIHQEELFIPYASADQRCSVATISVPRLLARLIRNRNERADLP